MTVETVSNSFTYTAGEPELSLLEHLCNALAVSGAEGEVRQIVLDELRPALKDHPGVDIQVDALGNLLVGVPGSGAGPRVRVMLSAHMDEVGLMLTNEEEKGIFRFGKVGGIDERQLPGKAVWVGAKHLPGVIGAKPIHLTQPDELKHKIPIDSLRIDVGLNSEGVKIGDRAAFATPFTRLGTSVRAKSLDNRLGVAVLIEVVKRAPANIDLMAAFTVQEEIGARGARVAAYTFKPDLGIALDSTPAYDLPPTEEGAENTVYNTHLGAGPAIYIADASTLSDPRLVRFFAETGEKHGVPFQFRQPGGGGTDASAIQRSGAGVPSLSISVPSRYQHTAASIGRILDWENTVRLILAGLNDLPADIVAAGRP